MSAVPWSAKETLRLSKLRDYCVLDTLPDKTYNDIVRLAAYICQTPAALITLIDTNRQWFKAKVGIDISETPRNVAFCSKTIQQPDTLIVEDASQHPQFRSNPFVTGPPYIRFYAGHPLVTPDGYALGALCVIDYQPRQMTSHQIDALQVLSHQVMAQLELGLQSQQLQHVNDSLEQRIKERTNSLSASLHRLLKVQSTLLKREAASRHSALHDSLTGLPNRSYFLKRLEQSIQLTQRDRNHQYAVLFIDLDNFKPVNDTLGHEIGDHLLTQVASRIKLLLRKSDLVARLGGDEFAILLDNITDRSQVIAATRRIQSQIAQPFAIEGRQISIGASVGVTFSQLGYQQAEAALKDADTAMYQAKRQAKEKSQLQISLQLEQQVNKSNSPIIIQDEPNQSVQQFVVFDSSVEDRSQARLILENDLRQALIGGQFQLHYQPIFELQKARLAGLEGLLRWQHPQRGWVCAREFIHIAEHIDVIRQLSPILIDQVCEQMAKWNSSFKLHLNISATQLRSPQFLAQWQTALKKHQLSASTFQLEIDESLLLSQETAITATLKALKALGFGICVDGFGKGHSSFSRLHQLKVDMLKIDSALVQSLLHTNDVDIVKTISDFGRSANMTVVASGIETSQQLSLLTSLNYQLGQGYWLAEALPAAKIEIAALQDLANDL
ncbi:MAG: EAL domain-containing protein [Cyanobacteria bacterium P01_D01_bin.1]